MAKNQQEQKSVLQNQQNLHEEVRKYLKIKRTDQQKDIKNHTPPKMQAKYNQWFSVVLTLIILALNFEQLFPSQQNKPQTGIIETSEMEKKVQYVFEHTILKYTIVYHFKMKDCQSYVPFMDSATLCSQKSVHVKSKLTYSIGFKPNLESLAYNSQNNTLIGSWGNLQILGSTDQYEIQEEQKSFFNYWSIIEFNRKYRQSIQGIKPTAQQKITSYIQNITSSQNSIQKFERNIRNSLMKIINEGRTNRVSISDRVMSTVNNGFNKILIFLSVKPIFIEQKSKQKDEFSADDATQFFKQEIIFQQNEQNDENQRELKQAQLKINDNNKFTSQKQIISYDPSSTQKKYSKLMQKVK